jgi:hypothetical protein
VLYSTLRQYLCLLQRVEDLLVQELIAQLPVEALTVPGEEVADGRKCDGDPAGGPGPESVLNHPR